MLGKETKGEPPYLGSCHYSIQMTWPGHTHYAPTRKCAGHTPKPNGSLGVCLYHLLVSALNKSIAHGQAAGRKQWLTQAQLPSVARQAEQCQSSTNECCCSHKKCNIRRKICSVVNQGPYSVSCAIGRCASTQLPLQMQPLSPVHLASRPTTTVLRGGVGWGGVGWGGVGAGSRPSSAAKLFTSVPAAT